MARPLHELLGFIFWCWRNDPDGQLGYPTALRRYYIEQGIAFGPALWMWEDVSPPKSTEGGRQ